MIRSPKWSLEIVTASVAEMAGAGLCPKASRLTTGSTGVHPSKQDGETGVDQAEGYSKTQKPSRDTFPCTPCPTAGIKTWKGFPRVKPRARMMAHTYERSTVTKHLLGLEESIGWIS